MGAEPEKFSPKEGSLFSTIVNGYPVRSVRRDGGVWLARVDLADAFKMTRTALSSKLAAKSIRLRTPSSNGGPQLHSFYREEDVREFVSRSRVVIAEYIALTEKRMNLSDSVRGTSASFIYAVRSECGRVKIGHTRNPKSRLRDLQVDNAYPVSLEIQSPSPRPRRHEIEVHRLLAESRVHGEWFSASSDVVRQAFLQAGLMISSATETSRG